MAFIEPLELETWFVNVFSGTTDIFSAIALLVLAGGAAFFRMSVMGLVFLVGLFYIMFSDYGGITLLTLTSIVGGLVIGYWIHRFVK